MQYDKGFKRLLAIACIYEQFQNLIGAKYSKKWLVDNYWHYNPGDKIVDIGCGPGTTLNYFTGDIEYVGLDISEEYIKSAQLKFGNRGKFLSGIASDFLGKPNNELLGADIVLCNGLLHHLNDRDALEVLQLAKEIMNPGARLICFEATFLEHQDGISKYITGKDRGRNVRKENEWKGLLEKVFPVFSTSVMTGLVFIPYIHIVMVCKNDY